MSIRPMGRGYQVRVKGYPTQTFPRKADAERYELDCRRRKALGEVYNPDVETLGESLDGLVAAKRATPRLAPRTIEFYERSVKAWERLRDTPLPQLRNADVEDLVHERAAAAPRSAKNELEALKAALRRSQRRGQRFDPAILMIEPVRVQEREGRALTLAQVDLVAARAPEHSRRMILFGARSGMRLGELLTLDDAVVDLEEAKLTVLRELNKSRRLKVIHLTSEEVMLLREQRLARAHGATLLFPTPEGGEWTRQNFYKRVWNDAVRAAGLAGVRFHDLRHTAISHMARSGMQPEAIALRVGHSDGGALIFKRYRHLFEDEMREQVERFEAYLREAKVSR